MLTTRSARLMNLKDYGIAPGNPADVVVIDAPSPKQAIAEIRHRSPCSSAAAHRHAPPRRTASSGLNESRFIMATDRFASRSTASPDALTPTST